MQANWLKENGDYLMYGLSNYKLINTCGTEGSYHGGPNDYVHEPFDVSSSINILVS